MRLRRFNVAILLIVALVMFNGCGPSGKAEMKAEIIDGVIHVHNGLTPLKGAVVLEVEEELRIDAGEVDSQNPPSFDTYSTDASGNFYLNHQSEPRIYKFDRHGKFLGAFVEKGEGPGEFPRSIYDFQVVDQSVWASYSRKIARFDLDGHYLEEHIFDRNVTLIEMVDSASMIGNYYANDQTDDRTRVCAYMNLTGKEHVPFLSDPAAGFTRLQIGNRVYTFFHGMITNDIMHAYDQSSRMVYLFLSGQPVIYRKTLTGQTDLVIHRDIPPITPEAGDIQEFEQHQFARWPQELRHTVARSLPPHFVYHNNIYILNSGHFILRRITGFQKYEMDIFNRDGQFLYTLKPGPQYPHFTRAGFLNNRLAVFQDIDDRDVLVLYRVKNLPEIFND